MIIEKRKFTKLEEEAFERTMLMLFPRLREMIEDLEGATECRARLSYRTRTDTEDLVVELLQNIYDAQFLRGVQAKLRQMVKGFSPAEQQVIAHRFFYPKKLTRSYGDMLVKNKSGFYRMVKRVLKKFSVMLSAEGWNQAWLEENLLCFSEVKNIYRKVLTEVILHNG